MAQFKTSYDIKNVENLTEFLTTATNGMSLSSISLSTGASRYALLQALGRKRISAILVKAISKEFGIDEEELIAVINGEHNNTKDTDSEELLKELNTTMCRILEQVCVQRTMLSSIGKILTNVESILENLKAEKGG